MAEVTTNFRDSNQGDLGKNLVSKEYLQAVYPKLAQSLFTGNLFSRTNGDTAFQGNNDSTGPNLNTRPIYTFSPKSDWIHASVSGSVDTSLAINSDGTLWWAGQSRPITGSSVFRSTPIQFGILTNWKCAYLGSRNAIYQNNDNNISITGDGKGGMGNQFITQYTWKAISDISNTSSNYPSASAVKTDGTLWSWGVNDGYSMGTGNYVPTIQIPIAPHGCSSLVRESTQSTQWKKCVRSSTTDLDSTTVLAIKNDGTLWIWGDNKEGSSDINFIPRRRSSLTPIPFPYNNTNWVTIPTTISAIDPTSFPTVTISTHVNYIKNDGSLWCWGDNRNGLYAVNDFDSRRPYTPRRELTSSTNWKMVDGSSGVQEPRYVFGLKTDGSLWTWGMNYNDYYPGFVTAASPVRYAPTLPATWKQVAVDKDYGGYSSGIVLLRNDNTIWQHNNSHFNYPAPIDNMVGFSPRQELTLSTNWQSLSAGRAHVAAIKTDGTLWSWGGNSLAGRLGNNTGASSTIALQEATSSTNWKQVSCGEHSTVALKTDGTVWGWGRLVNWYGSAIITRSSPVQEFSSSTNWRLIQNCSLCYVGIKQDGTLWSWGINNYGQLGNNSTILRSTPVQEWSSSTNWNYVLKSTGDTTAAVKNDGSLWLWGRNDHSQLGIESGEYLITPTQEYTNSTWIDISAVKTPGACKCIGIKQNGTLWTWGTSTPLLQIGTGKSWRSCAGGGSFTRVNALSTDGSLLVGGNDYIFLAKGSSELSWIGIKAQ